MLPFVLIGVITLIDVLVPRDVHLGALLAVAPALAASFVSARLAALVGIGATAALFAIAAARGTLLTSNHMSQVVALLVVSAFTVLVCRLRERNTAELRQVRSVAEAAQQVVLQPLPEHIGPLSVAYRYDAAADQARIGGDLYAAVRTERGTRLLIGDVRGKGLTAVDDADLLLGGFRSAAHRELPLPELLAELEATVEWGLRQPDRHGPDADESFITAALVDVPDDEPAVHVLNSGHPPPLRLHGGLVSPLTPGRYTPPIGLVPEPPLCGRPTSTPSSAATPCCSTPTASPRPATPRAASTRCPTAWPPPSPASCPPPTCSSPCAPTCCATPRVSWTTTPQWWRCAATAPWKGVRAAPRGPNAAPRCCAGCGSGAAGRTGGPGRSSRRSPTRGPAAARR